MKKILCATAICLALSAASAYSHHPTYYIDEELYERIDLMVADTPHVDLVFADDMGNTPDDIMGVVDDDGNMVSNETIETTTITAERVRDLEDLMRGGLLSEVSRLDGDVNVEIDFASEDGITMTIMQIE